MTHVTQTWRPEKAARDCFFLRSLNWLDKTLNSSDKYVILKFVNTFGDPRGSSESSGFFTPTEEKQ